jgi:hypothetical protein
MLVRRSRVASLTVDPKNFKPTVGASPAADGSVTGAGEIPGDSSTTVTATHPTVVSISSGGPSEESGSAPSSYTFAMPSKAVTLVAHFQKN